MENDFVITRIKNVILVGKDEYPEQKTVFNNDIKFNEIIFILSGKSTVLFNGKKMIDESGSIRFLPKGENRGYIVEREERGECIDVFFDTDVAVEKEAFELKTDAHVKIRNIFEKIFSVWVAKNDGYYFECISLLYKIFAELQKKEYIPQKQYELIKPAIDYIGRNFLNEKISMEYLASVCGISNSYMKKIFIRKFGIPPIKYIIQLKINYAKDLLRSGMYETGRIAQLCGYNNYYWFSRQFKEYTGITPTDFKKSCMK